MLFRTFQPSLSHPSSGADLCPSMLSHRHIENSLLLYVLSKLSFDVALFSGPFCAALDSSQLTLESDPEFLDSTWSVTSSCVSILVLVRASR